MQQSQERDLARRWASGELIGLPLRTTSGERLQKRRENSYLASGD